jgi:stage IV sporulation protein FB
MFGEPAPTQADLHFRVFGVPVRVHPMFWIVMLIMGVQGNEKLNPQDAITWVLAVFISILVHELGHAFLQIRYGGHPRITLYGMGGLASCNDCDRSPRSQILISLAGPIAGFLLAALTILIVRASGHRIAFLHPGDTGELGRALIARGFSIEPEVVPLFWLWAFYEGYVAPIANYLVRNLLWVNIMWGIINLFPIYPLDGGRVARELFSLGNPRQGIIQSLQLSIGAAALLAIWGLTRQSFYVVLLFGYLAYNSYQTLRAYQQRY